MINCCLRLLAPKAQYLLPGRRWAANRRLGCGIRAATYRVVHALGLQMGYPFLGLKVKPHRNISARIPHQSAARTSLADSFSPGEAIAPQRGDNDPTPTAQ